jgi:poly-gamma-glutamate system protein
MAYYGERMLKRLCLVLLATLAVLALCRSFLIIELPLPYIAEKKAAVELALRAQAVIGSRLIGPEYTPITTTLAPQRVKKMSLHPDFAAITVEWLKKAGVKSGNRVAVNLSGSFPALNIAVLSAIQSVGGEPIITSSVGSSTWGANDPDFTWLDMEAELQRAGVWTWASIAVSQGGVGDRGGGLTAEGKKLTRAAAQRNDIPLIDAANLQKSIERRLELYRGRAGEFPSVLVNVGGSHVIFGEAGHRAPLPQGLNIGYHPLLVTQDGLAAVFLQSNRPVIHFINIGQIAAQYGISSETPPQGSKAFRSPKLPVLIRLLAGIWLVGVVFVLWKNRPLLHRL